MASIKTLSPLKKYHDETRKVVVAEAIIRPTGLLDPAIILKPVTNQVDDVLEQVRQRVKKGQRVLITTLTKKFAEELDIYLKQISVKSAYIHSDVDTIERVEILSDLRRGKYDVLIGINLLREGLDLPEVGLVAIFDADKEGFLRSRTSLIQIIGRAARHVEGTVIMYAGTVTKSMQQAIDETDRRREIQIAYNKKHNITPKTTQRELKTVVDSLREEADENENYGKGAEEETMQNPLDEAMQIENRFARRGKGGRSKAFRSVTAPAAKKGKQVYASFEDKKEAYIDEIAAQNPSKFELETLLNKAIHEYDFEKAAAVRDIIALQEQE